MTGADPLKKLPREGCGHDSDSDECQPQNEVDPTQLRAPIADRPDPTGLFGGELLAKSINRSPQVVGQLYEVRSDSRDAGCHNQSRTPHSEQ